MIKFILASLLVGSSAIAFDVETYHTGYCRYGEDCGVVVSQDVDEARRICSQNVFEKEALRVRQQQADGSVKWLGYVCVVSDIRGPN